MQMSPSRELLYRSRARFACNFAIAGSNFTRFLETCTKSEYVMETCGGTTRTADSVSQAWRVSKRPQRRQIGYSSVASADFLRLRVGIGRESGVAPVEHVLRNLPAQERAFWHDGRGLDLVLAELEKIA